MTNPKIKRIIGERRAEAVQGEGKYGVLSKDNVLIWRGAQEDDAAKVARRAARSVRSLGDVEAVFYICELEEDND